MSATARDFLLSRLGVQLPPNAIPVMGLRIAHVGLEFLVLLVLAHLLGTQAFGIYAIAMSCAMVLGVPAAAGFDRLLIREVSALRSKQDWPALQGIRRRATQIALITSLLLAAGLVAWSQCIADPGPLQLALTISALLLPMMAFARLRQAAIQGMGRVPLGLIPESLVQPLIVLLLAGLGFAVFGLARSGAAALMMQVVAALAAMLVGIAILRRLWPEQANAAATFDTSRWVRSAMPMMWMLGMNMLLTGTDVIMLGWLMDEGVAGHYRVALQLAMLVSFPMTAINLAIAPELARLHASRDSVQLRIVAARASRWSLYAAVPVVLFLLIAGRPLLGIFGGGFELAFPALAVLVLGYLVNAFSGSAGYLLIMTRHEHLAAWIFTVAALVNVVANYLLIPPFGMMGAAVASAGSVALVAIGLWFFSRRCEVA